MFIGRDTLLVARVNAAHGRLSFFESFFAIAVATPQRRNSLAVGQIAHLVLRHGVDRLRQAGECVHRMPGDVEAEQLLLELESVWPAVSWRSGAGAAAVLPPLVLAGEWAPAPRSSMRVVPGAG